MCVCVCVCELMVRICLCVPIYIYIYIYIYNCPIGSTFPCKTVLKRKIMKQLFDI